METPKTHEEPEQNRLPFRPTNDAFFKKLFELRPDLLPSLAAGILDVAPDSINDIKPINGLTKTPTEIAPENMDAKFCRLDLSMMVNNQIIDIEVQVHHQADYIERTLYYWAKMVAAQVPRGGRYAELHRTVVASILGFTLFPKWEGCCSRFLPLEATRHDLLSDKLDMHYYELPKVPRFRDGDGPRFQWLNFFAARTEKDIAILGSKGDWFMQDAVMEYNALASNSDFAREAEFWEDRRRNEASALGGAFDEGLAEGKTIGLAEGKTIGLAEGKTIGLAEGKTIRREMQAEIERLNAEIQRLKKNHS